ncbi:hypothetical protein OAF41_00945 [bacterium]|jgi:hypothetical protein|nr:hypothetical protein [Akkermansiaceae bacterium]MDB4526685.1 hypothetical protein [bacterium]MDB4465635.1 hypothetical protein [Akkermansiaceae bacterium]MDB4489026.1 hypothetical protein [Akkermansiaceae bacterium]MDB4509898.1 hypothetical protein [Akkermansiaceae bacterium]
MKFVKFTSLVAFAAGSLGLSSCGCCTGEEPVPALRPLPVFKDVPVSREMPVTYEK